MLYKLVRIIFESAKWFWVAVLVAFTVTYLGNIAPLDRSSFVKGFSSSVMGYLFSPLPHLLITLCLVAALLVITLIAWIIVARHKDDPAALPAQAPMSMVSSYDALPEILMQLLHQKLPELEQQVSSNLEARLFIKAIRQSIGIEDLKLLPVPIPTQVLADARAIALRALKQCPEIGSAEVQEIITACLDTRELSKQVVEELTGNIWDYNVRKIAWSLLSQTWRMPPDAWASVVSFLNDEQAVICE